MIHVVAWSSLTEEQRRKVQLLNLMYIYEGFHNVECVFSRNTRQGNQFDFKTDTFQNVKYQHI